VSETGDDVVAAIDAHIEIMGALRSRLEANEGVLRRLQGALDGADIIRAMEMVETHNGVIATDVAVQDFYESRHRLREAALAAAMRAGMTTASAALLFGVPPDHVVGYTTERADRGA